MWIWYKDMIETEIMESVGTKEGPLAILEWGKSPHGGSN